MAEEQRDCAFFLEITYIFFHRFFFPNRLLYNAFLKNSLENFSEPDRNLEILSLTYAYRLNKDREQGEPEYILCMF